ncbi:Uncharacterized protein BP5553_04669 [Venustampulla echinocandica]|uniref:Uncharacterized protein n=1 Tax=Venustampulla echinocandica TaxID=2656787 RepID=A0A370TNY5_9HELO|nr:Uncharacterized protein BP5553_04669 [Venustampulla echinocandica]RDL37236.1 Uncharacterized protein BP5553_04669 [Venustampulla echinocandica]
MDPTADSQPASTSPYRPSIPITTEIRTHCQIYLDEQLYVSALALLNDLVTTGASHPDRINRPAIAPIPFHIELVSALLIHPRYTTQAPASERLELASRSLTLLRNILAILGPINARLDDAFSLEPMNATRASRRGRNTTDYDDGSSGSDEEEPERMQGILANKGRLRTCAKDFWHIVGWAFNCSVKHPQRWQHWKVWLEYMLDVLEADYTERERLDRKEHALNPGTLDARCEFKLLRKCMIAKYLSDVQSRSSAARRIARSVFADGSVASLKEFPEVYPNETKEVKFQNGQKRKRGFTLDRSFGGYDYQDADDPSEQPEMTDPEPESSQDDDEGNLSGQDPYLGGPESIALRQRVLKLLSQTAADFPVEFIDYRDLYEAIYTCMRPLPVPAFSLIISPSPSSQLPIIVLISLSQLLLLRLLPNTAPRPHTITKRDNDELTQAVLEQCFMPFSANTSAVDDNAKVSILIESLFRIFLRSCPCYHTPDLEEAIEKGIAAREDKIRGDKRRKDTAERRKEEESDRMWLTQSGERLRCLSAWVEQKSADDDHD